MAAQGAHILMQHVGTIEHFDPSGPNTFDQWYQRFGIYCDANGILPEPQNEEGAFLPAPNRRRNLFLTAIGPRAFAVVQAAVLPRAPNEEAIPTLVEVLKQQYQPSGLLEANRFTFHQRAQHAQESVFEFISALQTLAVQCDWGAFYDNAMKSQLIVGIRHADTRLKLIGTANLTWANAKNMALQDDVLRVQMRSLTQAHNQATATNVNAVHQKKPNNKGKPQPAKPSQPNSQPQQQSSKSESDQSSQPPRKYGPCHRCGRRHNAHTCPAKEWECFICKKKGHVSTRCPSKKKGTPVNFVGPNPSQSAPDPPGKVDQLVDQLLDFD